MKEIKFKIFGFSRLLKIYYDKQECVVYFNIENLKDLSEKTFLIIVFSDKKMVEERKLKYRHLWINFLNKWFDIKLCKV